MSEHSQSSKTNVSRRNFIRMAVSSLIWLPQTAGGGYILPTSKAYATTASSAQNEEDGGDKDDWDELAKITVVVFDEVGIVVLDAAEENETPVPGAHVVLTSRATNVSKEGDVDEEGKIIFNIKDMAENPDNQDINKLDEYAFNGSIKVTCDGFRTFETDLIRIEGTNCIVAPTRKKGDGNDRVPYPHKASLNEWDVLYTKNTFLTTDSNSDKHSFALELRDASPEKSTVELKNTKTGNVLKSSVVTPDSNGTLKVNYDESFLKLGDSKAFAQDNEYEVNLTQGSTTYSWPIQLNVQEGALDTPSENDALDLKPFDTTLTSGSKTTYDFKWPDWVPVLGGTRTKLLNVCSFPFSVYINPFGFVQITFSTPSWGYKKDSGEPDKGGWKKWPMSVPSKQYSKFYGDMKKTALKAANSSMMNSGKLRQIEMFASISATATAQLMAALQWDNKKGIFQGEAGGQIFLNLNMQLTENFWAGPVPVLISFGMDITAVVASTFQMYTDRAESGDVPLAKVLPTYALNPAHWHFYIDGSGVTITLSFSPFLSAGVGVRGIASVTVMGKLTFTIVTMFTIGAAKADGKPYPHAIGGVSAQISLVIQFLLFSQMFTIKDFPYKEIFNNWGEGVMTAGEDDVVTEDLHYLSLDEVFAGMTIIKDHQLASTSEFEGSIDLSTQADDEDEEPFDWETMRKDDVYRPLDDGTVIGYKVYHFPSAVEYLEEIEAEETAVEEASDAEGVTTEAEETVAAENTSEETIAEGTDPSLGVVAAEVGSLEAVSEMTGSEDAAVATAAEETLAEGAEPSLDVIAAEPATTAEGEAPAETATETNAEPEDEAKQDEEAPAPKRARRLRTRASVRYTPVSSGGLSTLASGTVLPDPGVSNVGNSGGIVPSSDIKVAENVFGDPRLRVVSLETSVGSSDGSSGIRATCCFRIGTVTINGKVRSRLIMTVLDATTIETDQQNAQRLDPYIGMKRVIEFDIDDIKGVNHEDLYDYDFGLSFTTYTRKTSMSTAEIDEIQLVIVSGKRPAGDDTSFADAATNLVFTYMRLEAREILSGDGNYVKMSVPAQNVIGDNKYHNISCINCVSDSDDFGSVVLVSYLDRSADSPDNVLSEDASVVTVRPGFLFVDVDGGDMYVPDTSHIDDKIGAINDATVFKLTLSPRIGDYYTLTMRSFDNTFFYLLDFDTEEAAFNSIKRCSVLDTSQTLVPWPQQDCFLTSYPNADYASQLSSLTQDEWDRTKWVLQKASWDASADEPTLQFTQIGPDNFNFSNFALNSSGTFIIWPQSRTGDDARIYDDDGSYELREAGPAYHLMACRIRNGKFSHPFIAADVAHDLVSPETVNTHDRYAPFEVLSTELLNSGEKGANGNDLYYASNIWYTSVPNVHVATITAAQGALPVAPAGGTAKFDVVVRNDGNSYLSGCTVKMYVHEDDGSVTYVDGSEKKLTFSADTMRPSPYNQLVDGKFTNTEDDFALAPGKRSVYRVEMPIPSSWAGEKYVSFTASNATIAEGGGLAALADEDDVVWQTFSIEPGSYKVNKYRTSLKQDKDQTHMVFLSIDDQEISSTPIGDAPLTVKTAGKEDEPKKGEVLPNTSDPSLVAVPAGLALAGAGLVAYGKRRKDVEDEENEDSDE